MSFYFEVFNPLAQWKKGDYPLSPQVAIRLATYRTESGGAVTVGPYLACRGRPETGRSWPK